MLIVEGNYGKSLSNAIAKRYSLRMISLTADKFANGDSRVKLAGDVSDQDCVIVQSMATRTNDSLVELLLIADALSESGAKSVRAVVPFLGYSFQNRHFEDEPISCRVSARMISASQIEEVIVIDLHEKSSIDFFDIPARNIETSKIFGEWLSRNSMNGYSIVTPDKGSKDRAEQLTSIVGGDVVVLDKKRDVQTLKVVKNEVIEGNVGKKCLVVDDAINSGGTLESVCEVLRAKGAEEIVWVSTHFLGLDGSYERVMKVVDKLVTTNTVDHGLSDSENTVVLDASKLVEL